MLGQFIDAAGPDVTLMSIHGGPYVFTEAFALQWVACKTRGIPDFFISVFSSLVCSGLLQLCSGALTHSQ